jgi:hypothetical protein
MTYTDKLNDIIKEALERLHDLINVSDQTCKDYNKLCLKINPNEYLINGDNSREIVEITNDHLIDCSGYQYSYGYLSADDLLLLIDYLIEVYE